MCLCAVVVTMTLRLKNKDKISIHTSDEVVAMLKKKSFHVEDYWCCC